MPTSDMILFAVGLVDFIFVLGFVLVTGFLTRKLTVGTEKEKPSAARKQQAA